MGSLTLAVDMMRVQALIILFNALMVAMVLSVPSPLIEFEDSHRDHNDITKENFGYEFHDPSILASSEGAVMLGNFLRELVRSAGMSNDTAASEAKALLDQLGIQHKTIPGGESADNQGIQKRQ